MTQLIKRILFATDFSRGAEQARNLAVNWAVQWKATLDLLHVVEFQPGMNVDDPVHKMYLDDLRAKAHSQLGTMARKIGQKEVMAKGRLEVGIPSQKIQEVAKELDSDLVVMGTLGRAGLDHLLVGSTAERVMRNAPCPVLAVRMPHHPEETSDSPTKDSSFECKHILVAVDFSDCSLEALEYAIPVAKRFEAAMTILNVLEPNAFGLDFTLRQVEERREARERTQSWLSALHELLASQGLTGDHQLLGGNPRDSILAYTRDHHFDLLVMGTHGRQGLSHVVTGSVAEWMLRHAFCPLLTVKSPKFAPGHKRVLPATLEALVLGE